MKRTLTLAAVATVALLGAGSAWANADLAKAKNCMACHTVDKKMVGPGYKEVAAKYKGKGAEAALEASILKGSSGKCGAIPMPANTVTEAEAKSLVKWILSL